MRFCYILIGRKVRGNEIRIWNGREITLVRILAIIFIDDEDIGQAALDIEMAILMERYPPRNRMVH